MFDVNSGKEIYQLGGNEGSNGPNCVSFSPDSKLVAAKYYPSPVVELFDVTTGKMMKRIKGHEAVRVAFSPDGTLFVTQDYDYGNDEFTIRIWDISDIP